MNAQEMKKIFEYSGYGYFGLRADDMEYEAGDFCNNSHQLFQDPEYDENGDLIFPFIDDPESPYCGFYDAGELVGTCAIKLDPENGKSFQDALETVKMYSGKHLYIIAGDRMEYGHDDGEIIIRDAVVLGIIGGK